MDTNDSQGVAVGYVDGDSSLDAVFANGGEENRVCLGNGLGDFTCSDVSLDTNGSTDIALGYLDGDSNLDAVFANHIQENRVCLGDGLGGFTCSDVSLDTNESFGVALGYVDDNTNLDAVFANFFMTNRVCLGDGLGGFTCSDVSTNDDSHFGVALGSLISDQIFADGFESGDTGAWSSSSPPRDRRTSCRWHRSAAPCAAEIAEGWGRRALNGGKSADETP